MRTKNRLALVVCALLAASTTRADVTDTTPYDYDLPPEAGKEGGTYAFQASGGAGPDCSFVVIGGVQDRTDPEMREMADRAIEKLVAGLVAGERSSLRSLRLSFSIPWSQVCLPKL